MTPEQVEALAPDAASLKAARDLTRKFRDTGRSERACWGLCQGSALYQACVDLTGPAYRCSCPSRKIPCKHCLGLLLLEGVPEAEPPAWVREWLAGRDERATKKPATEKTPDPVARARRAEQREERVKSGVEQLSRWLEDLARQGLASLQGQSYGYFDQVAARLVDAQCPGLAREVRYLSGSLQDRERFLLRLGRLHLLLQGYRKLDQLPEPLQAEIRSRIGWTTAQEELLQTEGIHDRWWVVGRRVEEDEQLTTQSTWLWAERRAQPALVLSFVPTGRPLDRSLPPGAALEAELVYFPGATAQRALVKARNELTPIPVRPSGQLPLTGVLDAYAEGLGQNPWLSRQGVMLGDVIPTSEGVRDTECRLLPYARGFEQHWRLEALSGGHPITLFGEWDGWSFDPLSCWNDTGWWEI